MYIYIHIFLYIYTCIGPRLPQVLRAHGPQGRKGYWFLHRRILASTNHIPEAIVWSFFETLIFANEEFIFESNN